MTRRDELIGVLHTYGAQSAGHGAGTLLAHLVGTADLLHAWGAREAVVDAGLFHSVYGTESYGAALLRAQDRSRLRSVLNEEAEALVYTFGAMEKESFYANLEHGRWAARDRFNGEEIALSRDQFGDLCDLTAANWLEQRPRAPASQRFIRREVFARMLPHLLAPGAAALAAAYGFRG